MIGPWSYQSSYFYPDHLDEPEPPECPNCGGWETPITNRWGEGGGTTCERCDKRREMHRDRGRQVKQRERRLGRDRAPEARRLAEHNEREAERLRAEWAGRREREQARWPKHVDIDDFEKDLPF